MAADVIWDQRSNARRQTVSRVVVHVFLRPEDELLHAVDVCNWFLLQRAFLSSSRRLRLNSLRDVLEVLQDQPATSRVIVSRSAGSGLATKHLD